MGNMHVSLSLLFLFIGTTSAKKQGDFGIFTACRIKDQQFNNSLRFTCNYANCSDSTPFNCFFLGFDRQYNASKGNCSYLWPNHWEWSGGKTTNYTCILTRKKRKEVKNITIDYNMPKGKAGYLKKCPAGADSLLYRGPPSLWPLVLLALWTVYGSSHHVVTTG